MPKTNGEYWKAKILRNVERHGTQLSELTAAGWEALTLWECELVDDGAVSQRLSTFL